MNSPVSSKKSSGILGTPREGQNGDFVRAAGVTLSPNIDCVKIVHHPEIELDLRMVHILS